MVFYRACIDKYEPCCEKLETDSKHWCFSNDAHVKAFFTKCSLLPVRSLLFRDLGRFYPIFLKLINYKMLEHRMLLIPLIYVFSFIYFEVYDLFLYDTHFVFFVSLANDLLLIFVYFRQFFKPFVDKRQKNSFK